MAGWKFWQRDADPVAELAPVDVLASVPADAWSAEAPPAAVPVINVRDLPQASSSYQPASVSKWDTGEKFFGSFGYTELLTLDYWTLRARSAQLFETNHYGRGIIRTLVTNVINTGLHLEATPEESVLGFEEGKLDAWSDSVEARFTLWGKFPRACDHREIQTFGALQAAACAEALIEGDVLCVLRQDRSTSIPRVQIIKGSAVQTPMDATPRPGNRIEHGVELDGNGRHVAFWIRDDEARFERIDAYGKRSGRRQAWLVYASDKRHDQVRGKPFLSLVLQSLREIDRYRDSVQRKATINSSITAWVEKTENTMGSRPLTGGGVGGAVRAGAIPGVQEASSQRTFKAEQINPSTIIDELNVGEKIHAHNSQGTDEKFGDFENAVIQSIAWTCNIPPEILTKAFSNNYSASQAAINEFKNYLDQARMSWGEQFCQPIYEDWLLASTLARRVDAPGLFESWIRGDEVTAAAWCLADWTGHVKPSVDIVKMAKGQSMLLDRGLTTYDRASRETTGTKFSTNVKKQRRERRALAELQEILGPELTASFDADAETEPDETDEAKSIALVRPLRG